MKNRINDFKSNASIISKSFSSEYKKTPLRIKVSGVQEARGGMQIGQRPSNTAEVANSSKFVVLCYFRLNMCV